MRAEVEVVKIAHRLCDEAQRFTAADIRAAAPPDSDVANLSLAYIDQVMALWQEVEWELIEERRAVSDAEGIVRGDA